MGVVFHLSIFSLLPLLFVLQLDDGASVTALMLAIQQQLAVPLEQQRISRDAALLTAKDGAGIRWGPADPAAVSATWLA
jgi:hypothetical protein